MKIIRNEKLIKRNGKIGGWAILAAIIILGAGFFINVNNLSGDDAQFFYLTLGSFIVGLILVQVGLYLTNRYGGRPRIDEKIDAALKGLSGDFHMYHFTTPVSHLLVGPAGIWALLPYRQRGVIAYTKDRWRLNNGGLIQAYMSIFGQEGLGRPDLSAAHDIQAIKKFLANRLQETEIPEINAALVFMNDEIEIQAENAPLLAIKIDAVKNYFRQKAKEKPIAPATLIAVKAALPE